MLPVLLLLLHTTLHATPAASPSGCAGQLDRTPQCAGLQQVASIITPDAAASSKDPVLDEKGRDPSVIPSELGIASLVLAASGVGVFAAWAGTTPQAEGEDALARQGTFALGASLVSLSALTAAGAIATWVFDPSAGTLRLPLFLDEEKR